MCRVPTIPRHAPANRSAQTPRETADGSSHCCRLARRSGDLNSQDALDAPSRVSRRRPRLIAVLTSSFADRISARLLEGPSIGHRPRRRKSAKSEMKRDTSVLARATMRRRGRLADTRAIALGHGEGLKSELGAKDEKDLGVPRPLRALPAGQPWQP